MFLPPVIRAMKAIPLATTVGSTLATRLAWTGVDHDGFYNNVDGTVTGYPESGPSVLVAAPTGSVALGVGLDSGIGSGIVTTDTTDNSGFNQDPDPITGEEDPVRDFLADEAYTSRFNGTSGRRPRSVGRDCVDVRSQPEPKLA